MEGLIRLATAPYVRQSDLASAIGSTRVRVHSRGKKDNKTGVWTCSLYTVVILF